MPWPLGRPVSERDLAFARAQIEGMVEGGIADDPDEAADMLLAIGEVSEHAHARLLSTEERELRYGTFRRSTAGRGTRP